MSELISTLNTADRLARAWRAGELAALLAIERLVADGWYGVAVTERGLVGYYRGIRFELGSAA